VANPVKCPFQLEGNHGPIGKRSKLIPKSTLLSSPDARVAVRVNCPVALRTRCKIDIVQCQQRFGDEQTRVAQINIGDRHHLQCAASRFVIKIRAVRRDQQSRPEKSGALDTKQPSHVG